MDLTRNLLLQALDAADGGVCIADATRPGYPLVYVNRGFTDMVGYAEREVLGRNCSFLQGEETAAEAVEQLRSALQQHQTATVTMLNYRKDGSSFWNELRIAPVKSADGEVTHYVGFQRDVTGLVEGIWRLDQTREQLRTANEQLKRLANQDTLTRLNNRRFFASEGAIRLRQAKRHHLTISLYMIDIDRFKAYNDHFGHVAGDKALATVASTLRNVFQRATDLLARFGGEEFIVLSTGSTFESTEKRAQFVCEAVTGLGIRAAPGAPDKLPELSVSVGCVFGPASQGLSLEAVTAQADDNLYAAKQAGRNQAICSAIAGTRMSTDELPYAKMLG